MKKLRTVVALLLALCMLFALAACGAEEKEAPPPSGTGTVPDGDDGAGDSFESYTIGYNNQGSGAWILDYMQAVTEHYAVDVLGMEINAMSANFSADQMMKDVQNMVQSGCRGLTIIPVMPTMLPSVSELCQDNGVYFAGFSQLIMEENLEYLRENPYYCGSVGMNAYEAGRSIGQMALDDGKSKAVIVAGAIGNTNHDNLIAGFTEVFEAGGGQVLDVGHSETEAAQRADDLIAAYGTEIDCAFGMGMDFADSLLTACSNYGLEAGKDVKIYAAELDANGVQYVKDGRMGGLSQQCIDSAFSAALVVNAIDGKLLLDENGEPVWADSMRLFEVNEDNADNYLKYFIEGFPIPNEDFDQLLYRCNPDVSYESFMDFVGSYSYEMVMDLRGE